MHSNNELGRGLLHHARGSAGMSEASSAVAYILDLPVPESKTQMAFEDTMRQRSGCKNLQNILLLISPTSMQNKEPVGLNIHCYRIDSRKHLGVTMVSQKDLRPIERCHRPNSFSIVHCNRHIETADAARNTPIKSQIFEVVREASKAVRSTWYKGYTVRLFYGVCDAKQKKNDLALTPHPKGISFLQQPKIARRKQRAVKQPPSLQLRKQGNLALLPLCLSNAAFCFLEKKLRYRGASGAFLKLRSLVEKINEQQSPRLEHLMCFFQLAEDLQFKMYIRRSIDLPWSSLSQGKRFLVDCFVFDDRKDYIASIALLYTQLHALARVFPGASQNFRFVDNAFELTPVPASVSKWLEATMEAFNRRHWYMQLGELVLKKIRPPMALLAWR